ncbi:MAG: alpha/beta fold hydrolase, partial [Solirubrobacterales bacterium]
GSLAASLSKLPEAEHEAFVLELVTGQVAAVLGHASGSAIDASTPFKDLGFDSLGAIELRNRLAQASGLRISATVVFEFPTSAAVARLLLREADGKGSADDQSEGGRLRAVVRDAHERGNVMETVFALSEYSRSADAFSSIKDLKDGVGVVDLVGPDAAARLKLFGIPTFMAAHGPHQFAQLAWTIGDGIDFAAVELPGLADDNPLPATFDALIESLADAILRRVDHTPFAIVGYSIGGSLAHAVAERLERLGAAPVGVVFIDSYTAPEAEMADVVSAIVGGMLDGGDQALNSDKGWIAIGGYLRVQGEWRPGEISTPRMLLRASMALGTAFEDGLLPDWQVPESVIVVPGTHSDILNSSVAQTAEALVNWLDALASSGDPE